MARMHSGSQACETEPLLKSNMKSMVQKDVKQTKCKARHSELEAHGLWSFRFAGVGLVWLEIQVNRKQAQPNPCEKKQRSVAIQGLLKQHGLNCKPGPLGTQGIW